MTAPFRLLFFRQHENRNGSAMRGILCSRCVPEGRDFARAFGRVEVCQLFLEPRADARGYFMPPLRGSARCEDNVSSPAFPASGNPEADGMYFLIRKAI